jgi:hypothetical protein
MEFEKLLLKCRGFRDGDGISIAIGSGLRSRVWYKGIDENKGLLIYTDRNMTKESVYPADPIVDVLPGKW